MSDGLRVVLAGIAVFVILSLAVKLTEKRTPGFSPSNEIVLKDAKPTPIQLEDYYDPNMGLELQRTGVTDEELKGVAELNPYDINLSDTKITGVGFKYLEGLAIGELTLSNTKIAPIYYEHLTKTKHLGSLIVDETNLTQEHVQVISKLPELTNVNADRTSFDDLAARTLAAARTLEFISLRHTKITDEALRAFGGLKLQGIDFSYTNVTDKGIGYLEVSGLLDAQLDSTKIGSGALEHLAKAKELSQLNASNTSVDDFGIRALSQNTTISHLDVSDTKITDQAFQTISTWPLMTLIVSGTHIGDSALHYLSAFKQEHPLEPGSPGWSPGLMTLYIGRTNITDSGLKRLAGLPLYNLSLNGAGITNEGVKNLELPTLFVLDLSETKVSGEVLKIPFISRLRDLDLASTNVADGDLASFKSEVLGSLSLESTQITDKGLKYLAKLPLLGFLDVGFTRVTGSGLSHLLSSHVTRLYLDGLKLPTPAFKTLADMKELRVLSLEGVVIDAEKLAALAQSKSLVMVTASKRFLPMNVIGAVREELGRPLPFKIVLRS